MVSFVAGLIVGAFLVYYHYYTKESIRSWSFTTRWELGGYVLILFEECSFDITLNKKKKIIDYINYRISTDNIVQYKDDMVRIFNIFVLNQIQDNPNSSIDYTSIFSQLLLKYSTDDARAKYHDFMSKYKV